jgi:putative MATE family efflux protein
MNDPGRVKRPAAPLNLGDRRLRRLIVRLAVPSVVGLSITALHHVVNAGFVGMLGTDAVAAVSVALPIFILVAAIGEGLGVGAAAAIGRFLGARAKGRGSVTATTALALAAAVGAVTTLVLLAGLEPLRVLLGATPATLPMAERYAGILALGCSLMLVQQVCDFVAIAEGNTRFSMWTLLGGFTLNIVLDPILIFALGLGVAGAALATLVAQVAALLAYAVYFAWAWGVVSVRPRLVRLRWPVLRPILVVGVPAMLTGGLTALAFALLYRSASLYGGDAAVAGVGIALRLLTLGFLPLAGFCLGAQAVLSFGWGARDHARVLAATRFMLRVTTGCAAGYALLVLLLANPIARLFTDDPAALAVAAAACLAFHACFALSGMQLVLLVLLQSLGKARLAALVGLAPQGYLLILALATLPRLWGLDGVIASPLVAAGLAGALSGTILRQELNALRRLAGGTNAAKRAPPRLPARAGPGSARARPAP